MPKYMLLLHNDPQWYTKLSPEEMQATTEKYMNWMKLPFVADSKRLSGDNGRILRRAEGETRIADGPYSETKEVLGGYYTIEAADYDEAVKRSGDHPHLGVGGTIEIRHVYGT